MHFIAQPISELRLKRLHRWAMLWLAWFAAFVDAAAAWSPLSQQAQAIGHRWLDGIERLLFAIIMVRAARHVRRLPPRNGPAPHRRKESGFRRAVIGYKLRRSLRAKDLRQRIERLRQDIEALVAQVLRRLPCGLTRRRPLLTRRCRARLRPVLGRPSLVAACDSS
jgi:hypothetical protein